MTTERVPAEYKKRDGSTEIVLVPPPLTEVTDSEIIIWLAGLPTSYNQTKGHHYGKHNAERRFWCAYAENSGRASQARVVDSRAHIEAWVWCGSDRRRDEDNFRTGCKPIIDGLVRAGVIPDDSVQWIETRYRFDTTKGEQGMRIEITSL